MGIEKRTHLSAGLRVIEINTADVGAILIGDGDKAALPIHQRRLGLFEYP